MQAGIRNLNIEGACWIHFIVVQDTDEIDGNAFLQNNGFIYILHRAKRHQITQPTAIRQYWCENP